MNFGMCTKIAMMPVSPSKERDLIKIFTRKILL
jgi:hypothetical protein